ncbi:hypothetical protein ZIOFF_062569 [Zingiber officinale]|uniref:Uncharacterized protein n=1 Tax=Zingiber officinale TaxID=94328 RepID=A0A8J5F594_ZINOF|nr:hypothetical protein ZIOFF_062569 [Zingiber officinale]
MSEHEKTKRQQEGNPRIDGTSSDIVEESSSTSLEGNQVVLKKNKKKKTKILEIEEVRGISDGKLEIDAEKDVKEAELEQHGNQDGKKKRRKDRDGDEGGNEAPKGAKNRKRKQEDGGLVNLNVDANTKKRKKDNVFEISDLSSGATPGEVSGDENKTSGKVADAENQTVCENSTGKKENVKAKRNKNDKKLEIPKHLVLETLEVQRHMVVENEVSTNDDKLHILVNKAKTKAKRVLDSCEHKENSHERCTNGSQSLSMEVRKEIQEIREMPSTSTAINVKRKKNKEKDGNEENQEAEEHSKNPLKIKGKIRKPFQTVEAEGNKETSNVMKEKAADDSVACSLKSKKSFSNGSNISSLKKKKVTFSSEIEVFTYRTDSGNEGNSEIPVIQGKHFTKEEDEKILEAIDEYIKHGNQDGKKKRRKDRDGDEGGNEAPKGAKNRKRKQEDGGLVNLNVDANTKKRKKDNVFEISDLSSGATPGEVSGDENKTSGKVADADNHTVCENSTGKIENVKAKRNKNDKKLEIPKHLVLETLEVQRHMVVENEVSTNDDKLHILVNKAKTKAKRVLDSCEHKENSHETCTNGSQSLSMEVRKEIQEIREMPSTSTAINVKRKKSKEKDGNAENQEAEEHSKNPLKIKGKIRKPFQTVEAEGNKETSNVMKEKEADDSVACSLKSKKSFSNGSNISSLKKKKVTFSSEIEVFTYRTDSGNEGNSEIPVIQGKHFTKEEDEKILEAIDEYIKVCLWGRLVCRNGLYETI